MTCTDRCKNAKPKSKCQCSCGGRNHAQNSEEKIPDGTRAVNEKMGGELGKMIKKLTGQTFTCLGVCNKKRKIDVLVAYPHDGGLADAEGNKWWLYYECEQCGYGTSWQKIERRI